MASLTELFNALAPLLQALSQNNGPETQRRGQ
jgi:hypothetical protein